MRTLFAVALALLAVGCGSEATEPGSAPEPLTAAPMVPTISGAASRPSTLPTGKRAFAWDAGAASAPFTIAVLPDTQFYTLAYPEIFEAQTRWIAANKDAEQIAFVLHEGDIVQNDTPEEWSRAGRYLHALDGIVPYALARGNHDLGGGISRIGGLMDSYFPAAEFLRYPWFRETFETGRMDNSFLLVEAGGRTWVILALEYGPRDAVLAWADRILTRHANLPAIIVTHAYLYGDNTRYDKVRHPHQEYNPKDLQLEGGANDGEEMWQKLISRHDNVLFVLSGHVTGDGVGILTSTRPSGTRCHQILANYQSHGHGGDGYLRLMRVDPTRGQVSVRTYSPHLDQHLTDRDNQFTLNLLD